MAIMPDGYYDNFDPAKNYEKILYRDGYTLQGAELNAQQSSALYRLRDIADALFKDGDIIRDAQIVINKANGQVQLAAGAVYIKGAVRGVPPASFSIPVEGMVAIGVRLTEKVISELDDPSLYNPALGSRGEGEPGAWRLQYVPEWAFDAGADTGEFYPVYMVDDGEIRAKEAPPTLDSVTQSLAKYDRDSTAGGSYVTSGLSVQRADDDNQGNQIYTVSEGRARVNGYGVELPTARRLTYAAKPDLRAIDTEVHIAEVSSTQSGGQRLNLAHAPLHSIDAVRITTRRTVTLTHGAYNGAQDILPDLAIVTLVECRQGEIVYKAGEDYKKSGDKVDWSPSGAEPATGSTYSCTYDCVVSVEVTKFDDDGFSIEGAVEGSSILVSYQQALPRIDRLVLTADGFFQWVNGVAAEMNARSPAVAEHLLPIATVYQTWRADGKGDSVLSDGVRVVPFSEIESINKRIDYVLVEIARQRLEADVFTREAGARVGIFVDPLLDDSMRDQGIGQTAAIVDGDLTLSIDAFVNNVPDDIETPIGLGYTPQILLTQSMRTGSMKVNPYMAFDVMPARVKLSPAVDFWTITKSQWKSDITRLLSHGWGNRSSSSISSVSALVVSENKKIGDLREIEVIFEVDGFGSEEELQSVSFDGINVSILPA